MPKITDTSKSLPHMLAPLLAGTGVIEAQEAAGQVEAVASEELPANIHDREAWEALGVIFGEPYPTDPVFCPATLPPGWSKRATDHSMHNDIIDDAGNRRGSFFYKAAFYDRRAMLYAPLTRYSVRRGRRSSERGSNYYDHAKHVTFEVWDSVADEVVFSSSEDVTAPAPIENDRSPENSKVHRAWWVEHEAIEARTADACRAWADENLPGWTDPGMHWPE